MKYLSNSIMFVLCMLVILAKYCFSFKILAVFPYNGRSHHILFSSLVEELSLRKHNVTVVNNFSVKKNPYLRQISLQDGNSHNCDVIDVEDHINNLPSIFTNFYRAYDAAQAFRQRANMNCEKLMSNQKIQEIITSGEVFDLIIAEQFVTDCGLALGYKLNAPTIGMTAHILMPWTYSRFGAPNNPAYVPNAIFNSGTTPHLWDKVQNAFINLGLSLYYAHVIQKENQEIVNKIYPDVPQLEILGRDISLFMVNQYFPLTGSRLYGSNVVQIGGMHINQEVVEFKDEDIKTFLDNAKNGVVYISFGTVASNLSRNVLHSIIKFISNIDMAFVWKIDNITDWTVPKNVLLKKWLPQPAILYFKTELNTYHAFGKTDLCLLWRLQYFGLNS